MIESFFSSSIELIFEGVFSSTLAREFSLNPSPVSFRIDYGEAKILLREVREYCSLLKRGHLSMFEKLYSSPSYTTPEWEKLREIRHLLISRNLAKMV